MLALATLSTLVVMGGGAMTSVANAGGSCHSPETDGKAATSAQVVIKDLCFGPTVLRVRPGATVTWVNRDDFAHVVVGHGYQWGSQGELYSGKRLSVSFKEPGIYPYSCYLHPGMNGVVLVGGSGAPDQVGSASTVAFAADPGSGSGSSSSSTASGSGRAAASAARQAPVAPAGAGTLPWRIATFSLAGLLLAGLLLAGLVLTVGTRRRQVALG
jgi:plastocyanin